ncbi:hypothetical protein BOW53_12030 [Solemya pervernicosa gill symbiont]|uniref:Uncharacterized protein n=1 Tax=Solemya pervernicosa gill symbiont TaxID=642797 RepID=A0A1T2L2F9_9GAMM|nr:hypothetical protein BOW53_12030 [Solemya pervernicosa gill symbiont]
MEQRAIREIIGGLPGLRFTSSGLHGATKRFHCMQMFGQHHPGIDRERVAQLHITDSITQPINMAGQ